MTWLQNRLRTGSGELGRPPTFSELELGADEIDVVDGFGHGVLDLKPRIDFEEVELAVVIEQKLDRARAAIACLRDERERGFAHLLPERCFDDRTRRLFDDFLVAPLHRALALAEHHALASAIAEDLDLDVARVRQETLDENGGVAETRRGFFRGALERRGECVSSFDDTHPAAAASSRRLHEKRRLDTTRIELIESVRTHRRKRRHPARVGDSFGALFVAQLAHSISGGTDESYRSALDSFGEIGVLREEAIARMKQARIPLLRGRDDYFRVEKARDFEDVVRFEAHEGVSVFGRRYHGNRVAPIARRAQNAPRDLASVRNDEFLHREDDFLRIDTRSAQAGVVFVKKDSRPNRPSGEQRASAI